MPPISNHKNSSTIARVLLVDDNRGGLKARCMVLDELGYQTVSTTCPREALELYIAASSSKTPFDLVVTDYRMPDMNGVELIEHLREHSPAIPVVLISGFVEPLGLTEKTTGANVVIMKSSNEVQHLVRAVQRLTGAKPSRKPPVSAAARAKRKAASS
jgi:CheY-like chemotaxis protein